MKNVTLVSIAGLCIFGIGCDTPSSIVVDNGAEMVEDVNEERTTTPPVQAEEEPEPVYEEQDECELTPTPFDAPPFGYDADWCFATESGMQCEWYIGADGTKGCYESYTFYNNECAWIFQHDYCN
tara:strand:- start:277 stop:651 length:375 start_codon:yes stop_codon:yes gene_type:complete